MNKELRRLGTVVLAMFLALFLSTTMIQAVTADTLQADGRNARTLYASYATERGPILVDGQPIAYSTPVNDEFRFQRVYPNAALYAPITGYITAYRSSQGIESAENEYLAGSSNDQFLENLNSIVTGQSPKGASVELTIDPAVQQAAWDALQGYQGAVVAMRPKTGEILAMVSTPSYDPNVLSQNASGTVIDDAYQALLDDPGNPLINRAMDGALDPPGSTFKLVVAAAALESGQYTIDSAFPNPAQLALPQTNSTIYNANNGTCGGGAEASVLTAIQLSCNIPMAELGQQLGYRAILQQAEKFGFNQSVSVPMASEPSTFPRVLDEPQTMLASFGQSSVRASPLQMAMVSAAIANDGVLMQPNLVESVVAADLTPIQSFQASEFGRPISSATAEALTQAMVASVDNGAASNAMIDGIQVAGKTGTAENGAGEPFTLWFTGFAPANDPEVVVAVVVQNGGGLGQDGTSSGISAPIGKQVLEAVLLR